ncbi:MAG: hypothetical protein E6K55_14065 [Gemmatimonadetes bacterium]|nr:MAG: hypothetical protein DMD67_15915 [Gemmatimonadota bacterium]PYO97677.1 MAG: hypothetical protein DMD61_11960 [Gemmatimonadota bacterium]TLY48440.1 MAG: hypothetical protein E6K55_14065 [Gemmatimonadota bacterium]
MIDALVAFTLAAGLLTITPGLDTALVLRTAAVEGSRRAMLAGAGICLGCLTWGMTTQFVPAGVSVTGFTMLLAGIHATEGILWFALLTLASRPLGTWLDRPRVAWTIDRATGVMLVGFGVGLLLRRRA